MNPQPAKIIRLRQSTVIIILVFQFVILALLAGGYVSLREVQSFNNRRAYDVCIGSNAQIQRVTDRLTIPVPIDPGASPIERAALEERNRRTAETRRNIDETVQENNESCKELLRTAR